jgi:hypothetical protein
MTRDLQALTAGVLLVPVGILAAAHHAAGTVRPEVLGAVALIAVLYSWVWLWWRPTRFEISAHGLSIVWPLRRRTIASAQLGRANAIDRAAFRRDYGRGLRVGAGGLWGGFGLLMTPKATFSYYVSRTDAFVLVPLASDRTLMLTPERPQAFVAALHGLQPRA